MYKQKPYQNPKKKQQNKNQLTSIDTSKDPELFGLEHGHLLQSSDLDDMDNNLAITDLPEDEQEEDDDDDDDNSYHNHDDLNNMNEHMEEQDHYPLPAKRHIGAVYRSGFLPSYRALRSTTGSGVGGSRFSRSGRARQFV